MVPLPIKCLRKSEDQLVGALTLIACIIGILVYRWIVFLTEWALILLQLTGFMAVAAALGILAWIGYILAITPPKSDTMDTGKPG